MSKGKNQQPIPNANANRAWDSLEDLFRNCGAYGLGPAALAPFFRNEALILAVKDQVALHNNAKILEQDVKEYTTRLLAIREKHKGRTGAATDANDNMLCIQIGQEYFDWCQSYEMVVIPTVETICQLFEEAGGDISNVPTNVPAL